MQPNPLVLSAVHDYCVETEFCRRCGMHKDYASHHVYDCASAGNVVAMSHLRATQIKIERLRETEAQLQKAADYLNSFAQGVRSIKIEKKPAGSKKKDCGEERPEKEVE